MPWFRQKSGNGQQIGMGFHHTGISVVNLQRSGSRLPQLVSCSFHEADGEVARGQQLVQLARKLKLKKTPVVVALEPGYYTLLQIEAPEVEPEELRLAVRWRIKDLIDFHIDDAVLDIFALPQTRRAGAPQTMFVVAVRKSIIQSIADQFHEADLNLCAIDITELSLRNLLSWYENTESGGVQALLYLAPDYGIIEIAQESTLYLNRRIEIGARDFQEQGGYGLDELMDSLILELQRSLDYHESEFGKGPVSALSIIGPEEHRDQLIEYASQNLAAHVEPMMVGRQIEGLGAVSPEQLNICVPALGAAMRPGV